MSIGRPLGALAPLWPLVLVGMLLPGCGGGTPREVRPIPPAGLAPVTPGELVQLRLAVEGFDSVFDSRSTEQDLLPFLVHAWATFYHRPDPAPTAEARYAFTEALCRARRSKDKEPRSLLLCMDRLRESLVDDLLAVTQAYRRSGRSDKVGEQRLSELEKVFRHHRMLLVAGRKHRDERRALLSLPPVTRCELDQPRVPVLALDRHGLSINGFPVVTTATGTPVLGPAEAESLSGLLESRLAETARGLEPSETSAPTGQLVVAAHRDLDVNRLMTALSIAGHLGVQRICLKTERLGSFPVPCCLPVRLAPPGMLPTDHLELGAKGVFRVAGERREPLPSKETLSGDVPSAIRLRPGARVAALAALVERFQAISQKGPELLLEASRPPKGGRKGPTPSRESGERPRLPSSSSVPGSELPPQNRP